MKETWRKEKERQELHNLLLILEHDHLLDLDHHSEPDIHQQSQLSGVRVFTTAPFLVHSETDIKELTNFDQSIK